MLSSHAQDISQDERHYLAIKKAIAEDKVSLVLELAGCTIVEKPEAIDISGLITSQTVKKDEYHILNIVPAIKMGETPLLIASTLLKVEIVEKLLAHEYMDLRLSCQGGSAIQRMVSAYKQSLEPLHNVLPSNENRLSYTSKDREKIQAITLKLLAQDIFISRTHKKIINFESFGLTTHRVQTSDLLLQLVELMGKYQNISTDHGYTFTLSQEMKYQALISTLFSVFEDSKTSKKWYKLAIESGLEAVRSDSDFYRLGEDIESYYLILLQSIVSEFNGENTLQISAAEAYIAAMELGACALRFPNDEKKSCFKIYFYIAKTIEEKFKEQAKEIVDEHSVQINSLLIQRPVQHSKFLTAYTAFHPESASTSKISNKQRLGKKIDYLVALRQAQDKGSRAATWQLIAESKNLIDEASVVVSKFLLGEETQDELQRAFVELYGLQGSVNYLQARDSFEQMGENLEHDSQKAFNAYLFSAMAQFQVWLAIDSNEQSTILKKVLQTFRKLLALYSSDLPLSYQIEVFALLCDFIKIIPKKYDKASVLDIFFIAQMKLASTANNKTQTDMLNYIYDELKNNGLLTHLYWSRILTGYTNSIEAAGSKKVYQQLLKQFDGLCDLPNVNDEMKCDLKVAITQMYEAKFDDLDVKELLNFVHNLKELKAAKRNSQKSFDLRGYSYVYKRLGDLQKKTPEKILSYRAATDLGDVTSIEALIRMLPVSSHMDLMISAIDNGLKKSLHPFNVSVIQKIYECFKNRSQNFSMEKIGLVDDYITAEKNVRRAHKLIENYKDEFELSRMVSESDYLPALIRLQTLHINNGNVRRSLYISARLCAEMALNADEACNRYGFKEPVIAAISDKSFMYILQSSKATSEYATLAKWYLYFITSLHKIKTAKSIAKVNDLLLGCLNDPKQSENIKYGLMNTLHLEENEFIRMQENLKSSTKDICKDITQNILEIERNPGTVLKKSRLSHFINATSRYVRCHLFDSRKHESKKDQIITITRRTSCSTLDGRYKP
jgi:hypothetical protein